MRALCIGVAIVIGAACSKKAAQEQPQGQAKPAEVKNVIELRDQPPSLAGLMLTSAEREQLEAKMATAPDEVLSLSKVTSLTGDQAKSIVAFKGSAIVLDKLEQLGAAEAEVLAQWQGPTLVLGVTQLDAATAAKLAQWPGVN